MTDLNELLESSFFGRFSDFIALILSNIPSSELDGVRVIGAHGLSVDLSFTLSFFSTLTWSDFLFSFSTFTTTSFSILLTCGFSSFARSSFNEVDLTSSIFSIFGVAFKEFSTEILTPFLVIFSFGITGLL